MINLNDYIEQFGDEEYVPLKIAQQAVAEAYSDNKLEEAMELIKKSVNEMNNSVNDALKDD